ncbi:MAG TPA: ABC transporter permease [Candidatus Bathyarchaeia archaeon]|nr:ABC transporter permease [Candidatus Bathyarchaeia archaeon]
MAGSIRGSGIAETAAVLPSPPRVRGRRWTVLRQAARTRLGPLGVVVTLATIAVALLAPAIAPYDPVKQDLGNTLARPDRAHLMGTDNVGRDVLSRMIWGTRVSLMAGFGSVALAVAAGGMLGLLAGYAGGRTDGLVMRLMDAVLSFPPLVLALALGAVLGAGLGGVVIALGVVYTPTFARLMRGQVLTITAREYVEAARALGAPGWRIAWQHVLPNASAPIVIQASLSVAFAILAEASLSFLGLGVQPPGASWGSMINAGRGYLQQAPWIVFWPGAALFVTVVGLNFVGDAVRDALDPRLRT